MASFVKEFLQNPSQTAYLASSTGRFAERLVDLGNIEHAITIVELGPGNGAVTKKIVEKKKKGAAFFALEINPAFVRTLKKRFPGVTVHEDSAARIAYYVQTHRMRSVDFVASTLPLSLWPEQEAKHLLKDIRDVLSPQGRFVMEMFVHTAHLPRGKRILRMLERTFPRIRRTSPLIGSILPLYLYSCQKI